MIDPVLKWTLVGLGVLTAIVLIGGIAIMIAKKKKEKRPESDEEVFFDVEQEDVPIKEESTKPYKNVNRTTTTPTTVITRYDKEPEKTPEGKVVGTTTSNYKTEGVKDVYHPLHASDGSKVAGALSGFGGFLSGAKERVGSYIAQANNEEVDAGNVNTGTNTPVHAPIPSNLQRGAGNRPIRTIKEEEDDDGDLREESQNQGERNLGHHLKQEPLEESVDKQTEIWGNMCHAYKKHAKKSSRLSKREIIDGFFENNEDYRKEVKEMDKTEQCCSNDGTLIPKDGRCQFVTSAKNGDLVRSYQLSENGKEYYDNKLMIENDSLGVGYASNAFSK